MLSYGVIRCRLKENKRNISFQRDIYNPSTVYQPGTYMSLVQSINKRKLNKFKNFHVYYEKDNLCYLLKYLNIENSTRGTYMSLVDRLC
jgi:hypothetical protein